MMTDPISDMLTRVRNASMARANVVEMPLSKMKLSIAKILQSRGYLEDVAVVNVANRDVLRLTVRYNNGVPAVTELKRISKPGRRVYVKADDVRHVRSGFGLAILSTPNGLMASDEAKKRRLGGELICEVY